VEATCSTAAEDICSTKGPADCWRSEWGTDVCAIWHERLSGNSRAILLRAATIFLASIAPWTCLPLEPSKRYRVLRQPDYQAHKR
jgi:hypothetical protein